MTRYARHCECDKRPRVQKPSSTWPLFLIGRQWREQNDKKNDSDGDLYQHQIGFVVSTL
jgi:hypothetical protein